MTITANGIVESETYPVWESYKLPADVKELDRLSLQHRIWTEMMQGLCPVPKSVLMEVLREREDRTPAILDLGSGSGIWAIEMAETFPHAQVVGFDLTKSKPSYIPPNCKFVQGDWNAGLSQFRNSFDVVHTRSVIGHMQEREWRFAFQEAMNCLRPGGLIMLLDGNFDLLDTRKESITPAVDGDADPQHSWISRYFLEIFKRGWENRFGGMAGPGPYYHSWLKQSSEVQPDSIGKQVFYSPVGWSGEGIRNGEKIGQMMRINLEEFIPGWRPLFLTTGTPAEAFETWMAKAKEELSRTRIRMYAQWPSAWGRKYE